MAKIMIIDDEIETLEIHTTYLENLHEVFAYQQGRKALEDVAMIKPDAILLDIEMPYMDGFEVLEQLRGIHGCEEIPVIGVTGQKNKTTVLKFMGKGGIAYLTKPIDKRSLQQKIQQILEKEEERQNKKKILLVDDEMESLLIYKSILQAQYSVMALNSSKMAMAYLLKFVPDLIILDYEMPLYNGKALFQMIQKIDRLRGVPVMFLTGTEDPDVLVDCATMVPTGVVRKSEDKEVLLRKIENFLKK